MILDSEIQRKGYGTKLLKRSKEINSELNGWVINSSKFKKANGEMYKSPIEFYQKNGFQDFPDIVLKINKFEIVKVKWTK